MMTHAPLLVLVVTSLVGCGKSKITADRVAGEYMFQYPSGDVEVLYMRVDSTYRHALYPDMASYEEGSSLLHESDGRWTVRRGQFNFDHWYLFCSSMEPNKPGSRPTRVTLGNVNWMPTDTVDMISIYFETGYNFRRVAR